MEIRELTPDDLDALLDVRTRAFGPVPPADVPVWRETSAVAMAEGRLLGAFDGARLAASARLRRLTQWWHGRPQPLAGVAGVVVNPEDRGRGVGTAIVRAAIERAREQGYALSALYPATTPIYRSLGYEHAGAMHHVTFPAEALRRLGAGGAAGLRRAGPGDAAEVVALLGRLHAADRASGVVSWEERTWRRLLGAEGDMRYIADDGLVVYRWDGDGLRVGTLVAGSRETAAALWSLVGSSSSVAERVVAVLAPEDPVFWLLRERSREQVTRVRWMLRVLDVAAAIGRRGFPAGVSLEAFVRVEGLGGWRLEVSGGSGTAVATASGQGPSLTLNGLSALFAGLPAATLRRGGMMAGDGRHDEALDVAFAARPYTLDYF
ncbi:GNAT family N-acetyltransferase [Thermoactinospora rubra]|uniref:GNAT family N-acetyltransferase n=1 Tax=Thermoactinospora rubra TaxID=1088767 RepID=UPI000A0F863C|nr:GNAT family N-acetyltransferase [Thermoactinospora rubra]